MVNETLRRVCLNLAQDWTVLYKKVDIRDVPVGGTFICGRDK